MTCAILFLCSLWGLDSSRPFLPPSQIPSRISTLKRLSADYLKQAHADVEAFARARQPVALKTGYNDYRCVIHAHSYLSHDSRGTIQEVAAAAKSAGVDAVFLT